MSRVLRAITVIAGCILLFGCGNQDEGSSDASKPAKEASVSSEAKGANNPLAGQQQLLKGAKGVQSLLDKDAEKKKEALKETD